jgi:hypothetical protein
MLFKFCLLLDAAVAGELGEGLGREAGRWRDYPAY